MNPILALWAVPRSTSTAFEWMMRQRGDHLCHHEPFGEVWYFGEDRRRPRETKEPPRPGLSFAAVWQSLQDNARQGPVFIKDFPHYILHMADQEFLGRFTHSFLIRDPEKVLPSMYTHWPDFAIEETGYREQRELFERLAERDGKAPPVIDSNDLLNDPETGVRLWCEAVGIDFLPDALEWSPGEREEVSWYDKGSWHDNLRSSGGLKPQTRNYVPIDHNDYLKRAYETCLPHYLVLHEQRLRMTP
jgi:adenylylsulfate kinase